MAGFNRRDALKMSAGFAATAAGFSCIELAHADPIQVPVIDSLALRVLVDSASDIFFKPAEIAGVKSEPGRSANSMLPLHSEWGLSLLLEPQRGGTKRSFLLDYGWTPGAINGNMELLKVDASKIEALIMSHGHWDHLGGLMGFLDKHRKSMPADLTIYAGGEDNFCQRYTRGAGGDLSDYGMLDRRELLKRDVKVMLCESPAVIGEMAFTTGKIKRNSIERVLPNSMVEFKLKDGAGCNWSHYLPAEMDGKIVPDEHIHEHATCFNLRDKGLIVISSCGHVAIVGGFHLGPAPADYLTQVVAEIGKLNPDVLIPMHCSGLNFTQEAQRQMPGKVLTTTTGTRITFGA